MTIYIYILLDTFQNEEVNATFSGKKIFKKKRKSLTRALSSCMCFFQRKENVVLLTSCAMASLVVMIIDEYDNICTF